MTESDEDRPLDPAEMLALIQKQERAVGLTYVAPVTWLYGIWGIAWLVGFTMLWAGWSFEWMPMAVAGTIFGLLIIASIVTSAIVGTRIGRGVRGASTFSGSVYGISWTLAGTAFAALGVGLAANGMSSELASLYYPSAYALMAGILYILGAALWNTKSQLVLGIVLLVIGAVAPFFGAPTNNLVMAIGGGGAFLVGAAHFLLAVRKAR
ncbi:MAG: hypothetical protein IR160_03975 [Salinibacterium sp.]|nr:hypothetical protein [Salinibacterium sp.]MBF0671725.1 hypothetical protein [Salinibacterium sp.]